MLNSDQSLFSLIVVLVKHRIIDSSHELSSFQVSSIFFSFFKIQFMNQVKQIRLLIKFDVLQFFFFFFKRRDETTFLLEI